MVAGQSFLLSDGKLTSKPGPTAQVKPPTFAELSEPEEDWLDRFVVEPESAPEDSAAAAQLVERVLMELSPAARLVVTLLEIEDRSVREIAQLTGWSIPLVKVRAFRARAEMKKCLQRMARDKYL